LSNLSPAHSLPAELYPALLPATHSGMSEPNVKTDVFKFFRQKYTGTLMINGGLAIEKGNAYCADGTADLVAFGTPFIANANLPELVAAGYGHGQLSPGGCAAVGACVGGVPTCQ
jgi:2,4-dienoyl-CoA reductase-like NADH-dependent reductase (Old Yellow Enzyme family)